MNNHSSIALVINLKIKLINYSYKESNLIKPFLVVNLLLIVEVQSKKDSYFILILMSLITYSI